MATRLSDDLPTAALGRALQARDVDAFLALCSDDVALHSPITERASFQGQSDVRVALRALFATLEDVEYLADVGEGTTRALFATANVGGEQMEMAARVELDDQQKARELTLFARPLPGLTALALGVGPRIAREFGGGIASWLSRVQLAPIASETRLFDRLVGMLVSRVRSRRRGNSS
jgi:SnoaL-like domain